MASVAGIAGVAGPTAGSASGQRAVSADTGSSPVAALAGRIRQIEIQLNDWATCVSATTPKGQAAIQKLSGEISAAKEQMAKALQMQSQASAQNPADGPAPNTASSRAGRVDVWA